MREFGLDATSLAGAYAGPTEYVGLVYSLGYGENEVRCCAAWLGCPSVLLRGWHLEGSGCHALKCALRSSSQRMAVG